MLLGRIILIYYIILMQQTFVDITEIAFSNDFQHEASIWKKD